MTPVSYAWACSGAWTKRTKAMRKDRAILAVFSFPGNLLSFFMVTLPSLCVCMCYCFLGCSFASSPGTLFRMKSSTFPYLL